MGASSFAPNGAYFTPPRGGQPVPAVRDLLVKSSDTSSAYIWHYWSVHRMVDANQPIRIFGDAHLLTFLGMDTMDIWALEEDATERDKQYEVFQLGHR